MRCPWNAGTRHPNTIGVCYDRLFSVLIDHGPLGHGKEKGSANIVWQSLQISLIKIRFQALLFRLMVWSNPPIVQGSLLLRLQMVRR